ncbi:PiggyBac transposable element-derived protein 4 [Eumeta japonica]|uniref:PiggyBac transposable element-derived protein 4 n=1 Tax=Eumeta variegata TaxID=151549 RepID=A0A4C1USZ4_EUMVA|nr:PiggyBac transposable element-derived protein 4 [Eumeta japonica]
MLVSFRGRCRWKKYMPNKPCKYGLEIKCLTDSTTSYLYNAYLYTGKNSDGNGLTDQEKQLLVPTQSVLRLAKPIMGTNRNITADNYFSSIEVCRELKKNGLTYVGTLKKNKREIPPEFLSKNRQVQSSIYGFTKELTLMSYVPKKNKTVMMISSMHHIESTDSTKGIPEIISFYNSSKGGVDSLDEKCAKYSCARRSRRWPLVIFYRILDIAAANSFILSNYDSANRLMFMKILGKSLVTPHLERRYTTPQLSHELSSLIGRILGKDKDNEIGQPSNEILRFDTMKNCHICFKLKRRKTRYGCQVCRQPVCLQCSKPTCNNCC